MRGATTAIMTTTWLLVAAFALVVFEGGLPVRAQPAVDHAARRVLPPPRRSGGPALASVLAARHSQRSFGAGDLDDATLGQLLWAAQGVTSAGHRTVPSAGALYPLQVRIADAHGVWRYVPADHALVREASGDHREAIARAAFGQESVRTAPVVLVISADFAVTASKYGQRAERFATLEAGHAAENVLLETTALELACVPVGAFEDGALRRAAGLPAGETPLYLIPLGPR